MQNLAYSIAYFQLKCNILHIILTFYIICQIFPINAHTTESCLSHCVCHSNS